MLECLEHHQWPGLPPNRRHDRPVGGHHQPLQLLVVVVWAGKSDGLGGCLEQLAELLLELRRLRLQVCAVNPEVALEVLTEPAHRLQEHVGPLVRRELAEERKPVAGPLPVRLGRTLDVVGRGLPYMLGLRRPRRTASGR